MVIVELRVTRPATEPQLSQEMRAQKSTIAQSRRYSHCNNSASLNLQIAFGIARIFWESHPNSRLESSLPWQTNGILTSRLAADPALKRFPGIISRKQPTAARFFPTEKTTLTKAAISTSFLTLPQVSAGMRAAPALPPQRNPYRKSDCARHPVWNARLTPQLRDLLRDSDTSVAQKFR